MVNQDTYCASTNDPTKLFLLTGSPNVLADKSTYQCIFVQLQDSNGKVTRAQQDITIGLSSSLTIVGTVDSSIIIPKGETFASANFTSTFYPGTTTIFASATGFCNGTLNNNHSWTHTFHNRSLWIPIKSAF